MTKLFVPGLRVVDKLNPENVYEIVSVSNRQAVAALVDKETNELVREETITLTKENSITVAFRDDSNVVYEKPEGYYVQDGIIMKNGEKVTEQGQIKVSSILGSIPGKLVLSVESRERSEDGYRDLFTYDVRPSYDEENDKMVTRDVFKKIYSESIPNPKPVLLSDEGLIIGFGSSYLRDVIGENGLPTKEEVLASAGLIRVGNKSRISIATLPFLPENVKVVNGKYAVIEVRKAINKELLEDEEYDEELLPLEEVKKPYSCICNGRLLLAIVDEVGITRIGNRTYETDSSISFSKGAFAERFEGTIFEQLKGMDYIDTSAEGNKITHYFSDKDRNVKAVTIESTPDRGNLMTVN